MDRVTRYPIFSIPRSLGMASPGPDGDASYTWQLVNVEPSASGQSAADHQARLTALGTRASRSLRSVPSQPSLQPESNEDEEVTGDVLPRQPWDLEWERWAVIQGQAVRKSGTVATRHGIPDRRDPSSPERPRSMPLQENAVDREQIDFLAARQQFLSLEQANAGVPRSPPTRVAPVCAPARVSPAPKAVKEPPLTNGYVASVKPQVKEVVMDQKRVRGLSTRSGVQAVGSPGAQSQAEPSEAPKETPIEREIRMAQEREAALRQQRGLQRTVRHQELVEIPTRLLLTKVSLIEAPRRDRGRPSLYVQRDMAQETQREEDHRRECLGWDWGSAPSLVFEGPQPGPRRSLSSDAILDLAPDADPTPELREVNRIPPDAYLPYVSPGTPQRPSSALRAHEPKAFSADGAKAAASPKAAGSQRQLLESSGKPSGAKQEFWKPPRGPPQANGGVVRREHFLLRPLRFRVRDVPQKAEVSRVWGWEVAGAPATRLQRSQSSELLDREVESVLRREQEVAEERRNALFPEVFSPEPGCDPDSRSSSQASGVTGSYSVSGLHFAPVRLHSGLVWRAEPPAEAVPEQRKKKEQWYAGIKPLDHINLEVLEATRVTRHKNTKAELWEARVYASEDED